MNDQTSNRWTDWFAAVAILVIPALLAVAIVWGASGTDGEHKGQAASAAVASSQQVTRAPSATVARPSMARQHQSMLDQMRVSVPPQMLDQMARNVMWHQMVASDLRSMEEQEEGLDRMLAR